MFSLYIARRYLFARHSHHTIGIISAISVGGVALATMALVVTLSVFNGFRDIRRKNSPGCFESCPDFIEAVCDRLNRAPYVCNGCEREHNCPLKKRYYIASGAQANYRGVLVNCRSGVRPDDAMVRMMGNYGSSTKYVNDVEGINSRLDETQAAVLSVKLPRLDADNERRRGVARQYGERIDNPLVTLPQEPKDMSEHVFYAYVVRCGYRDELQAWLKSQDVETLIHYPIAPHKQAALSASFGNVLLPVTEQLHREVLSLPISPLMTQSDIDRVVDAVNRFNPSER